MVRTQRTVIPLRRRPPKLPRKGSSWGKAARDMRPVLLLIGLATALALFEPSVTVTSYDPASPDPRFQGRFAGAELVEGSFGLCDAGYGRACVIDGDTFRIGQRAIRVVGIDTAEKDARCPAEAAQAQASTLAMQQWLNAGYFVMQPQASDTVDGYGRELQVIVRTGPDGDVERLADWMQRNGGARRLYGGERSGWC